MSVFIYSFDGQPLAIRLRRNTKTRIILRPCPPNSRIDAPPSAPAAICLQAGIPPWLKLSDFRRWLDQNPEPLRRILAHADTSGKPFRLPETIWYQGQPRRWHAAAVEQAAWDRHAAVFRLPENLPAERQAALLADFLYREAERHLLPLLAHHAAQTGWQPAAVQLSRAKTFWGICRPQRGIRLNWRLIGAPDFVQEYVCVHELCHLPHPNHSAAFWQTVRRHTPHADAARSWLKTYGKELFALG